MSSSELYSKNDRYCSIREAEADVIRPETEHHTTIEESITSNRLRYSDVGRALYLDIRPQLKSWEIAEIALMRLHGGVHVRSHNTKVRTKKYEPCRSVDDCICKHCDKRSGAQIDDNRHAMLGCDGAAGSIAVLRKQRDSKIRAIAREEGIEYEQLNAREKELLLLGVPPEQRSENRDEREAVMSKILSESAQYLYRMRQERLAHSA